VRESPLPTVGRDPFVALDSPALVGSACDDMLVPAIRLELALSAIVGLAIVVLIAVWLIPKWQARAVRTPASRAEASVRAARLSPLRRADLAGHLACPYAALDRASPLVVALHRDRVAVPEHLPVALARASSCIALRASYSEIAYDNGCYRRGPGSRDGGAL
jgi:hypothetical protein